jgi:predicted dehydrogenase
MNGLVVLKELLDLTIVNVTQFENSDRDRPDFSNKYLKMTYFFLNEGIISTLRKYFAHKQPQRRYLTFLVIENQNKKYLNISMQTQKNPSDFVLCNRFFPYSEIDFNKVSRDPEHYLNHFNQFTDKNNYEIFNIDTSHPISLQITQLQYDEEYNSGLFIYGLGGYIKMFVIQHFGKEIKKIACIDYKADIANNFKKNYGFKYSFLTPASSFPLLTKVNYPIAIIATYHSSHASLAFDIFNVNPNAKIFIEKPPTVTLDDLEKLIKLYKKGAHIEIGFNRRFIGYSKYIKDKVKNKTLIITCSIKEVLISNNHWYLWENQGTRVTGNAVHWFDLANYWTQSIPTEINVIAHPNDKESLAISVLYKNGSILNMTASDKGNSMRGVQEKIEIRFDNETIFINDFTSLTHIRNNGIIKRKRKLRRDKGHNDMYRNFLQIIEGREQSEYTVFELINTSVVTFYASKMLMEGIRYLSIEDEIEKYIHSFQENGI